MTAADLPPWFFRVFAFAWGAVWGSFATVVVHRWPRHSVVRPASHCPNCQKPVRPYDNVPILAWLWLRGRCRDCKAPISPRYALIEAMYALSALALVELLLREHDNLALSVFLALFFVRFAFAWGLLTASFIDLKKLLLPDFITLGGTALGITANILLPGIGWRASLLGVALGAGIPYAFYFVWDRFLKRDGLGLGDVKLLAMVGALLGPHAVVFALFVGSMQGIVATVLSRLTGWKLAPDIDPEDLEDDDTESVWERLAGLTARVTGWQRSAVREDVEDEAEDDATAPEQNANGTEPLMRTMIPFGPFLALGAIEYMLGGDRLMQAYLSLLHGQ